MERTIFARFSERSLAERAVRRVRRELSHDALVHVAIRPWSHPSSELDTRETHLLPALGHGVLIGAGSGLALGALVLLTDIRVFDVWVTLLFTMVLGAAFGAFGSSIIGSINPDPKLEDMEQHSHDRDVIVTVTTMSPESHHQAQAILSAHASRVEDATLTPEDA